MRAVLFKLAVVPLTFFFSSLCWLTARLGRDGRLSHAVECLWARCLVWTSGVRLEVDLSALDPGQTYIFMANHQSHMDIPILFAALPGWNFRFLAKESLFKIPVFGPAMRRMGHVAIDRGNRRKAMESIQEAVDLVSRGIGLLVFPEGTRSMDYSKLQEFKTGGMIVALKCQAQVAPLVLVGSGGVLPKHGRRLTPGVVRVRALPPFDAAALYTLKERENFKNDLWDRMDAAYQEMRA
ncbi:lysophospholipid acyltransferase family protein [Solidesulfovibrio carbinolicus]|uniref:1-acyl-sn-glycerol-3-phosphate acyltransferase n=1 Tax=Solidesulfovibrio carbinolicus TaxID=296842 RepID=A0A4P6HMQ1_9BACT|nr:lysophospholipid acyltransferase family protein [Solidesulfovibrio carbinolicus]QAZ66388.1 1-acyl-sn-glycerol-3-phosphate acyltransferase [Solidesulfovibrio carbinolicus]